MKQFLLCLLLVSAHQLSAQKFSSDKSFVRFFSDGLIEDITADNKQGSSLFDVSKNEIVFSIPIREFEFEKALMKQHFNSEKYMNSDKFPKATFQGKVTGFSATTTGEQNVTATGKLTIHGVTRDVEIKGTLVNNSGTLTIKTKFMVKLADYGVTIPKLVFKNIAEQVEVTLEFNYKSL